MADPGATTGSGVAPAIASAGAWVGAGGESTGAVARRGAGGGDVTGVGTGGRATAASLSRRNALPEEPGGGLAAAAGDAPDTCGRWPPTAGRALPVGKGLPLPRASSTSAMGAR